MATDNRPPDDASKSTELAVKRSSIGPLYWIIFAILCVVFGPKVLDVIKTGQYRDEIKATCGYIPGGDIMKQAHTRCADCVKSGGQWERLYGGSAADLLRAGVCNKKTDTKR